MAAKPTPSLVDDPVPVEPADEMDDLRAAVNKLDEAREKVERQLALLEDRIERRKHDWHETANHVTALNLGEAKRDEREKSLWNLLTRLEQTVTNNYAERKEQIAAAKFTHEALDKRVSDLSEKLGKKIDDVAEKRSANWRSNAALVVALAVAVLKILEWLGK